jgi:hypothetical protein
MVAEMGDMLGSGGCREAQAWGDDYMTLLCQTRILASPYQSLLGLVVQEALRRLWLSRGGARLGNRAQQIMTGTFKHLGKALLGK